MFIRRNPGIFQSMVQTWDDFIERRFENINCIHEKKKDGEGGFGSKLLKKGKDKSLLKYKSKQDLERR